MRKREKVQEVLRDHGGCGKLLGQIMQIAVRAVTAALAGQICREITACLPEYFGLPEANERYARGMRAQTTFAATSECLKN